MKNNNIKISKVCGLCSGCKFAIDSTLNQLQSDKKIALFKEIVHNQNVNDFLSYKGIAIENELKNLSNYDTIILRAHGESKSTIEYLQKNNINFVDCTCVNVKKIHDEVALHSKMNETIIIIGKYGKLSNKIHPEILGTIGWCESEPILIEDEEDVEKLNLIKNQPLYLVCQTTFNMEKAEKIIAKIEQIAVKNRCDLQINKSICMAQKQINKFSENLAFESDLMFVVGGKNSSNTIELYNNLKTIKPTIFLENIHKWEQELINNNIKLKKNIKIGLTAGASTMKSELEELKNLIETKLEELEMSIQINSHNSIQIDNLYFDPFQIKKPLPPAKYLFITHSHYDHLSVEDIKKVSDKNTVFVAPKDCQETLESNFENKVIYVKPKERLTLGEIQVKTFPSYNLNKVFHKKEMNWVGYKITYHGKTYAIVGDSDATPELEKLSCDVLFVPIGGTYTMTAEEAAILTKKIKPQLVIPTHYSSIVGSKNDAKVFVKALNKEVEHKLLIK